MKIVKNKNELLANEDFQKYEMNIPLPVFQNLKPVETKSFLR
jgi:hypothetical protein